MYGGGRAGRAVARHGEVDPAAAQGLQLVLLAIRPIPLDLRCVLWNENNNILANANEIQSKSNRRGAESSGAVVEVAGGALVRESLVGSGKAAAAVGVAAGIGAFPGVRAHVCAHVV